MFSEIASIVLWWTCKLLEPPMLKLQATGWRRRNLRTSVAQALINTYLPQFHILDLSVCDALKTPPMGAVHLRCDFLHSVPPLGKSSKFSVSGNEYLTLDLLSVRIHPTPIRIRGTFQRYVGTSGKHEPGKCGGEVSVYWREAAQTNALDNSTGRFGVQRV